MGGSWKEYSLNFYFPTGSNNIRVVTLLRKRKLPGRGQSTNNIPAVIAAAAGYILCTISRVEPATLHRQTHSSHPVAYYILKEKIGCKIFFNTEYDAVLDSD